MWIERLMAGISHQHVLSYNPQIINLPSPSFFAKLKIVDLSVI